MEIAEKYIAEVRTNQEMILSREDNKEFKDAKDGKNDEQLPENKN